MGEPGPSHPDAGPPEIEPPFVDPTAYDEVNTDHPGPGPEASTSEAGQPVQPGVSIQPDDLVQEPDYDDPGRTIHLPKLETTQCFVDALGTVSLESSGMQP